MGERQITERKTVAFGPVCDLPSWHWVGEDTARELSKDYNIVTYKSFTAVPSCDVLFVIKQRPPEIFVKIALAQHSKLIYAPLDYYLNNEQLQKDANLLRKFHLVLSHCERLIPLLAPHCQLVRYVDHHHKYALPQMADYKENGYVLWIGGCQYVPYLVKWLREHPIHTEIKILTDSNNDRARSAANLLASKLGMDLIIAQAAEHIDGHEIHIWSEHLQSAMMSECKAAIDIKDETDFNQRHKPATKAQQYIASGIPFAINSGSYSSEYFSCRGLELSTPTTTHRWFSKEYWEQTRQCGEELRKYTSIEVIGQWYKQLIETLSPLPRT